LDNSKSIKSEESKVEEVRAPDGKLMRTYTVQNHQMNGPMIIYDDNERIAQKLNYENNKLSGSAEFYQDGVPLMYSQFQNGVLNGPAILFVDGIKSGETTFKNGVIDGIFASFDKQGRIIREATYVNGKMEGDCYLYYPDGIVQEKSFYKNNKLEGTTIKYYHSGAVLEIANYENGLPVGYVEIYDENGNSISRKEA